MSDKMIVKNKDKILTILKQLTKDGKINIDETKDAIFNDNAIFYLVYEYLVKEKLIKSNLYGQIHLTPKTYLKANQYILNNQLININDQMSELDKVREILEYNISLIEETL